MAQTSINIRMDEDLKRDFDITCNDLGLSMTAAKNIPNAETIAAIEEVEAMIKDPTLGKSYTDIDEMMKELLA